MTDSRRLGASAKQRQRSILIWSGIVFAVLVLTWIAERVHLRALQRWGPGRMEQIVDKAEERINVRFDAMQTAMLQHAAALAGDSLVVAALHDPTRRPELVRHMAHMRLLDRWSVAVYDTSATLLAWQGASVAPIALASPDTDQVRWSLAQDGTWRQALELWYPVAGALGHVRLLQLLYRHTPVQNEYLRDFRIGEEWSRLVGLPVRTSFDAPPLIEEGRTLATQDGTVVGSFVLEAPSPASYRGKVRQTYRDLIALWITCLLGLALALIWTRYRQRRSASWLVAFLLALWSSRYALLYIDVPGRWQAGKAPLNPLFDATHMASSVGGGLLNSTGDLLISALFLLATALMVLRFAYHWFREVPGPNESWQMLSQHAGHAGLMLFAVACCLGMTVLLGSAARHAVLDSTLSYHSREALIPETLVWVVLCSLAVMTLAVVLIIAAVFRVVLGARLRTPEAWQGAGMVIALVAVIALLVVADRSFALPWLVGLAFLGVGIAAVFLRAGHGLQWFTVRNLLLVTLVVSALLYPLLFSGLSERRHSRMEHAAAYFDRGFDPSVAFALRDLLERARTDTLMAAAVAKQDSVGLHDAVLRLHHGTLLASRGAFDLNVQLMDTNFQVIRGASPTLTVWAEHMQAQGPASDEMETEVFPEGDVGDGRAYIGIAPIRARGILAGWILARVAPEVLPEEANTPLLRTLLSSGFRDLFENLSLGSFHDGLLLRSIGRSFRHFTLDPGVAQGLQDIPALWNIDTYGDRRYEAYYLDRGQGNVVGVRASVVSVFDHLYYLLRVILAGLSVAVPFYLTGLALRRAAGVLPARRVPFQDKVLNAFLILAIIAVIPVGIVGERVVTEENTKAIQSWLRNHLQLVETALAAEARGNESPFEVLERLSLETLAARMGVDLTLYDSQSLVASSRSRLATERLTEMRLPVQAYEALFLDRYKTAFVAQELGSFRYTAGYHALVDAQGVPRYVLSVPTLPEQERIEEERARTLAYLFGALLALMTLVMLTASLLSSALARPIARLQQGLQAVGQGRFERRLPVQTRDEVGTLAQTFNDMQGQLAESRRQLTLQERQLAWREMARQVAHEIKNPLTPMKLSVQHLQRAFEARAPGIAGRFDALFRRITTTLVQEIGALAHIADEFASFARMPARMLEHQDLNEVIREAVVLMREEAPSTISLALHLPQEPLVVQADREELKRIYINLIKNALEALIDDAAGTITVTASRKDGQAVSRVSDTGRGIAPEVKDRIFEPSFSTKTSGTGLGLAIAKQCIADYGGTIGFRARDARGTEFFILLPLSG